MKFLRALFLSVLLIGPASAADYVAGPSGGSNLPGTRTNDNACAGCVGETITAVAPNTTATVTISQATPGVITWTAHGLGVNAPVQFTTTGALPTGLAISTTYFVTTGSVTTNTFSVSDTVAHAVAGVALATSSAGSGTQTAISAAFLTSVTPANILAVTLTAGDWRMWGTVAFAPAGSTTVTIVEGTLSSVSATFPALPGLGATALLTTSLTTGGGQLLPLGSTRVSLAAPTTIYLVANSQFGTSTMNAYGFMGATRTR